MEHLGFDKNNHETLDIQAMSTSWASRRLIGIFFVIQSWHLLIQGWFQGLPRTWDPLYGKLPILFPYHSHVFRDSCGHSMGPQGGTIISSTDLFFFGGPGCLPHQRPLGHQSRLQSSGWCSVAGGVVSPLVGFIHSRFGCWWFQAINKNFTQRSKYMANRPQKVGSYRAYINQYNGNCATYFYPGVVKLDHFLK